MRQQPQENNWQALQWIHYLVCFNCSALGVSFTTKSFHFKSFENAFSALAV